MSECERTVEIVRGGAADETHLAGCEACRDARLVQTYLRRLAAADDVSPVLPDPRLVLLKAELVRSQRELRAEGDRTRWAGVGVWVAIAVSWLVVLTWKFSEIQGLIETFHLSSVIPGGSTVAALLVAAFGGLVAFTVFAVAVHSVLAEM